MLTEDDQDRQLDAQAREHERALDRLIEYQQTGFIRLGNGLALLLTDE